MHIVIIDLEWNNVYGRKINGFINEIIEIGAVKLDDKLELIDEFNSFVKPSIGKRLRGSVKKLTHITNEDVQAGEPFTRVFADFRKWIGSEPTLVMSWGDGDIRVLIENFKYLNGIAYIPFLTDYADMQPYIQTKLGIDKSKQVGLSKAAELLEIDESGYALHRALDDSRLSAECLRKLYDFDELLPYIKTCDADFYARLAFKPYAIANLKNPLVDRKYLSCTCPDCGVPSARQTDWKYTNRFHRAVFCCPVCGSRVKVSVRYMRMYDRVEVKRTITKCPEENNE